MHLKTQDLKVERYQREDGVPSAAIRLTHRHVDHSIENNETDSPRENLRRALATLAAEINPNPATITKPSFYPHDEVLLRLPESIQEGVVVGIDFDFKVKRWKYDLACKQSHADGEYDAADLEARTE